MPKYITGNANVDSVLIIDNTEYDEVEFSFLVPTLSRVDTLKETLNSIVCLQGLSDIHYEIVVVDNTGDFSEKNKTRHYIENSRIPNLKYFINEKNIGMEGNWNRALELASADFVCFIHDDDVFGKNYLQEVKNCFAMIKSFDGFGFIKFGFKPFHNCEYLPQLDFMKKRLRCASLLEAILFGIGPTWTPSCGLIFSKTAFLDVGGFDAELFPSADHAFGVAMIEQGYKGYICNVQVAYYRCGINESMKLGTIQEFIKKDTEIRGSMYKKKRYGRVLERLFETQIYSERIDFWINYAKEWFCQDISIEQLDYKHCYIDSSYAKCMLVCLRKLCVFCSRVYGEIVFFNNKL